MDRSRQTEYNTLTQAYTNLPISGNQPMPTAYLSLGSNLGDRAANLRAALESLESAELHITAVSSIVETVPVGETTEPVPDYLNLVAEAETSLPPEALLIHTQSVEKALGRVPTFRWGPRIIDIDILVYDQVTLESERLTIPHPRLFERAFALLPLAELAPDLRFPDGSTMRARLEDPVIKTQGLHKWTRPNV
jgi:2-amino-4-hydroxy-6-hydroxymethyldihydropteridine diphosphokinase